MAFTEIEHGLDWQNADFINEFVDAYNERMPSFEIGRSVGDQRASTEQIAAVDIGDAIQARSFWFSFQRKIVDQFNWSSIARVYDPDDSDIYRDVFMRWLIPVADPGEGATAPSQTSWNGFCTATADISDYGFRRAQSYDPATDDWTDLNDAMWSRDENGHGFIQVGDIIGPWIFADLQTALDNMRTRYFAAQPNIQVKAERKTVSDSGSVSYADMVTAFNAASVTEEVSTMEVQHLKNAGLFSQRLRRTRHRFGMWARGVTAGDYVIAPRTTWALGAQATDMAAFYVQIVADVFDANGDSVVEDIYNKMAEVAIGDASAWIGSLAAPNEYTGSDGYRGYVRGGNGYTIIPFDFEWVKPAP